MTIARATSLLSGESITVDFPDTDRAPMPDLIDRVVKAMIHGYMTVDDIHIMLLGEGLDEYQAYLTFIGGKMIYEAKLKA